MSLAAATPHRQARRTPTAWRIAPTARGPCRRYQSL